MARRRMRRVVLVTGMSGTGKSTVLAELGRRGHRVIDTDDSGLIVDMETSDGTEPTWALDRIGTLLDGHRAGWLFIAGCVANQGVMYHRFDAVVLLSAPRDVIMDRVVDRANPFGSLPEDRAKIARDQATFEPLLRAGADYEITTTAPVAEVATVLEQVAAGADKGASRSSLPKQIGVVGEAGPYSVALTASTLFIITSTQQIWASAAPTLPHVSHHHPQVVAGGDGRPDQ